MNRATLKMPNRYDIPGQPSNRAIPEQLALISGYRQVNENLQPAEKIVCRRPASAASPAPSPEKYRFRIPSRWSFVQEELRFGSRFLADARQQYERDWLCSPLNIRAQRRIAPPASSDRDEV